MNTNTCVVEGYDLFPSTVRELFKAQFVPIMMRLSQHERILFQGREASNEFTKASINVLQILVGLSLGFFGLHSIGHICQNAKVQESFSMLSQLISYELEVSLVKR